MGKNQPLISRTLGGRFKLMARIGEGAMASVFRATDLSHPDGAEVAVKVMHPHLSVDDTFAARFKREAKAASMVQHPNSVAILEVGEEAGIHYLVMELCRGRDLRETLRTERQLGEPRAVRIVMSICEALAAAHKLGIVHRDLKPENVMVMSDPNSETDSVKVLDFGIAKLVDPQANLRGSTSESEPAALTQMGVVIGTPKYMSPEQCRGQPLDGRSDIYTCGILLYQLTTGVVPFDSPSPVEIAGRQAFEAPPPPSAHLASLDPALESIILQCLAKAPADRPESAVLLHHMLSQWLSDLVPRGLEAEAKFDPLLRTIPLGAVAPSVADYLRTQALLSPAQQASTVVEPVALESTPPPTQSAADDSDDANDSWGAFGVFMLLLSLAAGVGLGFAVFRFVPL